MFVFLEIIMFLYIINAVMTGFITITVVSHVSTLKSFYINNTNVHALEIIKYEYVINVELY